MIMARSKEMPKPNEALKDYFSDNEVFADLFNAYAFGGRQVINPDELQPADSAYAASVKTDGIKGVEKIGKYRDVIRKTTIEARFIILSIESQDKIHYSMPVRNMLYDALGYSAECRSLGDSQKNKTWTVNEFLSNLSKGTRLTPIFTIVFYTGAEPWDGPMCLHDMLDLDEGLKFFIPDYKVNLVDIGHGRSLPYASSLKGLDVAMKSIYAKEATDAEMLISDSIISLAGILANDRTLYQAEGGARTMCAALEEIRNEGRAEGRAQGRAEERAQGLKALVITCRDLGAQKKTAVEQLQLKYSLSEEEASERVDLYWDH